MGTIITCYPIIQGPLGGLSSQRLTAAVSNFGGLGSFGAHGLVPDAIEDVIGEIRSLTAKPFAMNLWVSMEDAEAHTSDAATFRRALSHLSPHIESLRGTQPEFAPYKPIRFEDQAGVLLDANVPAFSFIYGVPPKEILGEARKRGVVTLGTATTPDEAIALEQAGVDVVVASGFEAGGHRGLFSRSAQDSLTGTFSLVPQTVDAVKVPVVAAGGIADTRGIAAAVVGAEGVQMGTVFLACEESGAHPLHLEAILSGRAGQDRTDSGTLQGRLARGIDNELLQTLNKPGVNVLPYPLQRRRLMRSLALPAQKAGNRDLRTCSALCGSDERQLRARCQRITELLQSLVGAALQNG